MGRSSDQRGKQQGRLSRMLSSLLELLIQKIALRLISFSRRVLFKGLGKRFLSRGMRKELESEMAEGLLRWLVRGMGWISNIDDQFSKDINGFAGRYQFMTADKSVQVAVLFNRKERRVIEGSINDADVTAVFFERKDLIDYLVSVLREYHRKGEPPDAMKLILRHRVKIEGNVSYMMRFLYMANHVQLFVTGGLP